MSIILKATCESFKLNIQRTADGNFQFLFNLFRIHKPPNAAGHRRLSAFSLREKIRKVHYACPGIFYRLSLLILEFYKSILRNNLPEH